MENYKEKYEQALENLKRIKNANRNNKELVDFIEYQYPELKESEGEKVRKWLIEMVEALRKANPTNASHNGNCSEAIFWLEKQGEQKSTWSKKDEELEHEIKVILANTDFSNFALHYTFSDMVYWFKSFKERITGEINNNDN